MSRDRWMPLSVAAVLIAIGVWIARHTYWEETTLVTPPSGAAARDRFYALSHLAAAVGIDAHPIGSLRGLPADGIVLIDSLSDDVRREPLQNLQAWVQSGGRLIIGGNTLAASETLQTWSGIVPAPPAGGSSPAIPHAVRSGLASTPECKPRTVDLSGVPTKRSLVLCGGLRTRLASQRVATWSLSDASGIQALRVPIGRGELTVIGPAWILSNASLPVKDHAEIFFAAAGLKRGDRLELLSRIRPPPLPLLLWGLAAPGIVFLGIALALLLLRQLPRFGPPLPPPTAARRSLAEQIRADARFAWRTRRLGGLRAALRRSLDEAAQRQIAGFASMPPQRRALALSQLTGVDAGAICAALLCAESDDVNEHRAAITLLEVCRRMLIASDTIQRRRA